MHRIGARHCHRHREAIGPVRVRWLVPNVEAVDWEFWARCRASVAATRQPGLQAVFLRVLVRLSTPGRPALSVRNDHTVAIAKNVAPYPIVNGSNKIDSKRLDGIITKSIPNGCIKHKAHAFFKLTPSVVVKIPIRKLAKTNAPNAT